MENKKHIISICGAGGKTTKCIDMAVIYAKKNKSVAITTTTNMQKILKIDEYNNNLFYKNLKPVNLNDAIKHIKKGKIFFVGSILNDYKIKSLKYDEYIKLCEYFDVVIIETDGSKWMPIKIPRIIQKKFFFKTKYEFVEPVIPDNTNEIIVVFGKQSIGRKIKTVCQRYDELKSDLKKIKNVKINDDTIVTEKIIKKMANELYKKPLQTKFNVPIKLYLSNLNKYKTNYKKITFVLCAAGLSKRYGENKLIEKINNKKLYEIELKNIIKAKEDIIKKYKKNFNKLIKIDIVIVLNNNTIEKEIKEKYKNLQIIKNLNQTKGISYSIKLGVEKNKTSDAICFFNMDMPNLSAFSIENMIINYLLTNREIGVMHDKISIKNPAIFSKKYYREILKLKGDSGCKKIIEKNLYDLYVYHIDDKETFDIDTKIDMKNFIKNIEKN